MSSTYLQPGDRIRVKVVPVRPVSRKRILVILSAGALAWATASAILLGTGVATINDYNGTYGVSVSVWPHHYCSADFTVQGDVVASASCQPDGL